MATKEKNAKGAQKSVQPEGVGGKVGEFKEFFEESKAELKKVTWPSKKETTSTVIAVLVFTVVMSIYLGLVDVTLSKLVEFILS